MRFTVALAIALIFLPIVSTPSLTTAYAMVAPYSSPSSWQGSTRNQSENASPLDVELLSLAASEPSDGWVTYDGKLAIRNNGESSRSLGESSTWLADLPIDVGASHVETQEGETYPVELYLSQVALPPHVWVSGGNNGPFSIGFRVPELLHPTQAVIVADSSPVAFPIELRSAADASQVVNAAAPTNPLPATLQLDAVEVTLDPTATAVAQGEYWSPGQGSISLAIGITARNTDITADSQLSFDAALVDAAGQVYGAGSGTNQQTCEIPGTIGPGQTAQGGLCFALPVEAFRSGSFAVSIFGPSVDETFGVTSPALANCVQNPDLPNEISPFGDVERVTKDQELAVPGVASGQLSSSEWHRIRFPGAVSELLDIFISGELLDGDSSSSAGWFALLHDPSGQEIPMGDPSLGETTGIPLLCDGMYSLYISPTADTTYTVTVYADGPEQEIENAIEALANDDLFALLPTDDELPAGLVRIGDAQRTLAEVADRQYGDPDELRRLFTAWGWQGNAAADFAWPEGTTGPSDGLSTVYLSIHQFRDWNAAAAALDYTFHDLLVQHDWVEDLSVTIGDHSRAVSATGTEGNDVNLYVQQENLLLIMVARSPQGDPLQDAISLAQTILNSKNIDSGASDQETSEEQPAKFDLAGLLPTAEEAPEGLVETDSEVRTLLEEVSEAYNDPADAKRRFTEWGWQGNVYREFAWPEDATPPADATSYCYVSVHQFRDSVAAAQAIDYAFQDSLVAYDGEEVSIDPIGDHARAFASTNEDGNYIDLYIQQEDLLIIVEAFAEAGDPTFDAIQVAKAVLAK